MRAVMGAGAFYVKHIGAHGWAHRLVMQVNELGQDQDDGHINGQVWVCRDRISDRSTRLVLLERDLMHAPSAIDSGQKLPVTSAKAPKRAAPLSCSERELQSCHA